jgi:hypothetical protein
MGKRMTLELHETKQVSTGSAIAIFPVDRQHARIKAAARHLFNRRSRVAADRYRQELADTLFAQLSGLGLSEEAQDEAVGAFLMAVEREMALIHFERIKMHL